MSSRAAAPVALAVGRRSQRALVPRWADLVFPGVVGYGPAWFARGCHWGAQSLRQGRVPACDDAPFAQRQAARVQMVGGQVWAGEGKSVSARHRVPPALAAEARALAYPPIHLAVYQLSPSLPWCRLDDAHPASVPLHSLHLTASRKLAATLSAHYTLRWEPVKASILLWHALKSNQDPFARIVR